MATNIFVYWWDRLGDRAFDHHSRNGGGGGGQGRAFDHHSRNGGEEGRAGHLTIIVGMGGRRAGQGI